MKICCYQHSTNLDNYAVVVTFSTSLTNSYQVYVVTISTSNGVSGIGNGPYFLTKFSEWQVTSKVINKVVVQKGVVQLQLLRNRRTTTVIGKRVYMVVTTAILVW